MPRHLADLVRRTQENVAAFDAGAEPTLSVNIGVLDGLNTLYAQLPKALEALQEQLAEVAEFHEHWRDEFASASEQYAEIGMIDLAATYKENSVMHGNFVAVLRGDGIEHVEGPVGVDEPHWYRSVRHECPICKTAQYTRERARGDKPEKIAERVRVMRQICHRCKYAMG